MIVHEVWLAWAREQADPKPSWLVLWADLSEPDREVDRRIGEDLWTRGFIAGLQATGGPEIYRADGDMVCNQCQHTYYQHPLDREIRDDHDQPFIHRLCNGDRVKL
jgi:hypothetical protein